MLWKKVISPDRKRQAIKQVVGVLDVSERKACRVLGQHRSTQRYDKRVADDEIVLTERVIELASQYGRYGYRRVTALLRNEGWIVNHKRVECIWRREGLQVTQKQPKRSRLLLNDDSVFRLRPLFPKQIAHRRRQIVAGQYSSDTVFGLSALFDQPFAMSCVPPQVSHLFRRGIGCRQIVQPGQMGQDCRIDFVCLDCCIGNRFDLFGMR